MTNILRSVKSMIVAAVLGLMSGLAGPASAKPLKVFILAGQSNMQGHVNVSTFDSMADDPKTAPILKEMRNADGTPRVCEKVWISSVGCALRPPGYELDKVCFCNPKGNHGLRVSR